MEKDKKGALSLSRWREDRALFVLPVVQSRAGKSKQVSCLNIIRRAVVQQSNASHAENVIRRCYIFDIMACLHQGILMSHPIFRLSNLPLSMGLILIPVHGLRGSQCPRPNISAAFMTTIKASGSFRWMISRKVVIRLDSTTTKIIVFS